MGFNCGIVGLPNVGKSTLFNALTNAHAESANYPFCTIDANHGVVPVPDERLDRIAEIFKPQSKVPTALEFVDIAGLVKGASKGEGLGNQFLGNIRNVDALAHVVRCFEDPDVVHVDGSIDPVRDIGVIHTELILSDLEGIEKRMQKNLKLMKGQDKTAARQNDVLVHLKKELNQGKLARQTGLPAEEEELVWDLFLITLKPYFYVCNVSEADTQKSSPEFSEVAELAGRETVPVVRICGKLEAEIAELAAGEKKQFLKDYGLELSGLELMAKTGHDLLGLITYFTAGPKEVRAWTVVRGTTAPQAAGVIHSDFEKGFIKAEVYHYGDLIRLGSPVKVKEAGLYRIEGRDYVVKDGDIMFFRFQV